MDGTGDAPTGGDRGVPTARLRAPRLRRDRLARQRLTDQLEAANAPLIVIAAPAGFGKTTAVMNWVEATERPLVWLPADEIDNDLVRFFSRWSDALEPQVGRGRLHGLLTGPAQGELSADLVGAAAAEDLAGLDDRSVLLVEDLHRVTDSAVHTALRAVADRLAPHVTLAITSRSDPQFPLAKLRADGLLAELRSADLAFTPEESTELLAGLVGTELSDEDVATLNRRIEGWAVGLHLAGLSLAGRDDLREFVAAFAGDDRHVADYLVQEVVERESPEMQRFLLETSVLDDLTAELCRAATGDDSAAAKLNELYERNLFISSLDTKGEWFRYHHLFADLLKTRLRRSNPDRYGDVLMAAGHWSEEHGDPDQALRYFVAGGSLTEAAQLERRHASELLRHGDIGRLMAWLAVFPPGFVESVPELILGRAWCAIFTMRSADAMRDLDAADALGPEAFDNAITGQIEIMKAMAAWIDGDADATRHHAEEGLDMLSPTNRNLPSLGRLYLGRAAMATGDIGVAEAKYDEAAARGEAVGNLFVALSAYLGQASVDWHRGDLDAADERYRAAETLTERAAYVGRDLPVAGAALVGRGVVAFERFELDAAIELLRRGLSELRRTAYLEYTTLGYRRWAEAESFHGNHDAAAEVLREAMDHLGSFGAGGRSLAQALADCEIRNLMRAGEVDAAEQAYRKITLDQLQRPGDLANAQFDHVGTGLRVDLARGRADDAWARALLLLDLAGDNIGLGIKARTLQASCVAAGGDTETARELVLAALQNAAPGGWVRPFVDAGVGRLLPAGDPDPAIRDLIERVQQGTHVGGSAESRPQPLVDPLTPRELEVLDEIAAGFTNAQIADRLFISVGTAKRHVANIFLKLAAGHRAEAVAKARSLGMLG